MRPWSQSYHRTGEPAEPGLHAESWVSPATSDPAWDDFLRGSHCGQFQQSSYWAEYKARDGWRHHRIVLTTAERIIGGFQILWRPARLGRIGYVSKGPVADPDDPAVVRQLDRLLRSAAHELGLIAMVIQQPDESRVRLDTQPGTAYLRSNPMRVVEATFLVDTRGNLDDLRARMSASLRRNLRKAHRQQSITLREGTAADLPTFFTLMASTCRRLDTPPNPESAEALRRLWDVFARDRLVRLTLAEHRGVALAAKFSLAFGETVSVWKKGWDGTHGELHPNELLEEESLVWANRHGFRAVDFCSFSRSAAERSASGQPVSANELNTRDQYHLRFGGRSQLISPSLVLLPNPALRWLYASTYARFIRFRQRFGLSGSSPS